MAFTDILGRVVDNRLQGIENRFNQVGNLMSGDTDAWAAQFGLETEEEKRRRREREQQQQDLANVVVTSTKVDTYGDGSQTETVKREISAPVSPDDFGAQPEAMAQPIAQPEPVVQPSVQTSPQALQAAVPAPAPAPQAPAGQPGPIVYRQPQAQAPQAVAQPQPMVQPMAQPQAMPQAQTMPAAPVAPAAPAPAMAAPAPVAPVAQAPAMPQLPQPGPAVQVASTVPGAGVAEAAAAAQAAQTPAEPAWMTEANAAGNDFDKLVDVVAKFPEARSSLREKMKTALENQRKEKEAEQLVLDATKGNPKAINKLQQALRPEKGREKEEVTTSDYVKAYLYARLGLNELASEAQKKIIGKTTKFGQVQIEGTNWEVETDSTGRIVAARDDEGTVATESTLNKLRASAQKFGSQAFGFTSGISTLPSTGEPLQARQNSITGNAEYVYMTGPNRGTVYTGTEIPVPQRVSAQAMVDYNKKLIDFNSSPNIAGATELMKIAVANDRGDGEEIKKAKTDIANKLGMGGLAQILGGQQVPAGQGGTAIQQEGAATKQGGAATKQGGATQQGSGAGVRQGGGVSLSYSPSAKKAGESEVMYRERLKREETAFNAEVQKRKELEVAEGKPPAEARGKIEAKDINNQNFANSTYELVKPIADLIKKSTGSGIGTGVDKLAGLLGKSSTGAEAIAELEVLTYPLVSNVPRFEGPQGVRDVELYERAAGDLQNSSKPVKVRLAALNAIITMLKKYDKAGTNDWTFSQEKPSGGIKIISREKVR